MDWATQHEVTPLSIAFAKVQNPTLVFADRKSPEKQGSVVYAKVSGDA